MESAVKDMVLSNSVPADVSSIERELQRQGQRHGAGEPVMRTRTLNLVVTSRARPLPSAIVEQLAGAHPCRAILIDQGAIAGGFRAEVSSSCSLTHTGSSCLAREQVRLHTPDELTGEELERVVVPLLVPDLPVFLWWRGGADVDDPLFLRLVSHCQRVVVDSAEYAEAWSGLAALSRAVSGRRWSAAVSDLAWSRITAWRELTAQFFDNPRCVEYSAHIRAAHIVAGDGDSVSSDAVLFAAWIARQLAWQPAGGPRSNRNGQRLAFQRDGNRCEIQFTTLRDSGRGLQSVGLISTGDERDARFFIEQTRGAAGLITTTQLGQQQAVQRTVRSRTVTLAEMLGRELSSIRHDTLYEQVLGEVATISGTAQ